MHRRLLLPLLALAWFLPGMQDCAGFEHGTGYMGEALFASRAQAYLEYATAEHADSPLNAIAHMERDLVDPGYDAPAGQVGVGAWASRFAQFETYEDTRDFGGLYMLNALLGYEGHPYLTDDLWDDIREALLSFKMWYTDATPPFPDTSDTDCIPFFPIFQDGICRDWDNSFYWTENHQILYHTIEYLAGQRFPGECFTQVGFTPSGTCDGTDADGRPFEMTGQAHMDRARGLILRWLDDRWEIGFAEWHSNIYYQKDVTPLLTLVEFADDEEIATRAAIILDQILLDMALHAHRDTLAGTAGRSAMKDKWWGPRNDTWGITHLLFRQQEDLEYFSRGDPGATLLARAKKYRMPEVARRAALSTRTFVDRERHSVWIDERIDAPDAPVPFAGPFHGSPAYMPNRPDDDPSHGFDVDFADPGASADRFTFWWGLGAWTAWQVVPLTVSTGDVFNLWNTDLLRPFQALRLLLGPLDQPAPVSSMNTAQSLALQLWALATVGLLKEANTYTYRTKDYLLATVQDYRMGANVGQVQSWTLTIDPAAMVFTTHPMNAVQPPSDWIDRDEGEPGYWSGSASSPRSAQHRNVGIHLYSPAYSDGGTLGFFDYEPLTHAYFPQDHFDEVIQMDGWTFGRKGEAYVALYSWRATTWQVYEMTELDLLGFSQSFDLVADGPPPFAIPEGSTIAPQGPDNVWVVEAGSQSQWGTFADFRSAVLAASLTVTPQPGPVSSGQTGPNIHQYFDVAYQSPSLGLVTFGSEADLTVGGQVVPIRDYPRFDNPWLRMERGSSQAFMYDGPYVAFHDWPSATRTVARGE